MQDAASLGLRPHHPYAPDQAFLLPQLLLALGVRDLLVSLPQSSIMGCFGDGLRDNSYTLLDRRA